MTIKECIDMVLELKKDPIKNKEMIEFYDNLINRETKKVLESIKL